MDKDIRWEQRFSNYKKALSQLEEAVALAQKRDLSELEKQGLIQGFEYTHELAWNTLKDYLEYQGDATIRGSRDTTREAFALGLIPDGEGWMDMIKSRNLSSHTYNLETAEQISKTIVSSYLPLFIDLKNQFEKLKQNGNQNLFDKEI